MSTPASQIAKTLGDSTTKKTNPAQTYPNNQGTATIYPAEDWDRLEKLSQLGAQMGAYLMANHAGNVDSQERILQDLANFLALAATQTESAKRKVEELDKALQTQKDLMEQNKQLLNQLERIKSSNYFMGLPGNPLSTEGLPSNPLSTEGLPNTPLSIEGLPNNPLSTEGLPAHSSPNVDVPIQPAGNLRKSP